jgi:hypothetical protein
MLVTVPALQAEVRGLSNGIALEGMKQEMTALQSQFHVTNSHLARIEDSSSSGGDDDDDKSVQASCPLLFINMPELSMFVHPSQLWQSIRLTSLAASSSGISATGGTSTTEPSTSAFGTMMPMPDNVTSRAPAAA